MTPKHAAVARTLNWSKKSVYQGVKPAAGRRRSTVLQYMYGVLGLSGAVTFSVRGR